MKRWIKKIAIWIMLATILVAFSITSKEIMKLNNEPFYMKKIDVLKENEQSLNTTHSKDYYLENTFKETGSKNLVTGIYLEYRLFDSIFEASILLIVSTGIIFISKNDKAKSLGNKAKISYILVYISRFLYPFILLFGFYIIMHGDLSPGGGFQGGAILATVFILSYFIHTKKTFNINRLVKSEKFYFIAILIIVSISFFTKGTLFSNFSPIDAPIHRKRIFLLLLNFLIGLKVATGLTIIFSTFIEEGK